MHTQGIPLFFSINEMQNHKIFRKFEGKDYGTPMYICTLSLSKTSLIFKTSLTPM